MSYQTLNEMGTLDIWLSLKAMDKGLQAKYACTRDHIVLHV
jgi:hypothetical protein